MATAKPEQEPSMEEILASIRRIIAEEGGDVPAGEAKDAPNIRLAILMDCGNRLEESGEFHRAVRPRAISRRRINVPRLSGVDQSRTPVARVMFRLFERTVRIIAAGDEQRRKRQRGRIGTRPGLPVDEASAPWSMIR